MSGSMKQLRLKLWYTPPGTWYKGITKGKVPKKKVEIGEVEGKLPKKKVEIGEVEGKVPKKNVEIGEGGGQST